MYSEKKDPRVQWEFGYGQSYTTFAYDNLKVEQDASTTSDGIEITFDVTNTGDMKGDEIAQIYLSPDSSVQNIRPVKLQGFARVTLEPGATRQVTVRLFPEQFGYYTNDGTRNWNIDPGKYIIKIGASSADIRLQEEITLKGKKVTKPIRDRYFSETTIR